ncbi:MAG: hypothetical protein AB7G80_02365 [Dongiaceae bacterium]
MSKYNTGDVRVDKLLNVPGGFIASLESQVVDAASYGRGGKAKAIDPRMIARQRER